MTAADFCTIKTCLAFLFPLIPFGDVTDLLIIIFPLQLYIYFFKQVIIRLNRINKNGGMGVKMVELFVYCKQI
jgi:hypothetical protein